MKIYLAGAIRDGHTEDIYWRDKVAHALETSACFVLSPTGGKRYFPQTNSWQCCGIPPTANSIVHQDFAMIRKADALVCNFEALAEGYQMLGTLIEVGYAAAHEKLIYSIWPRHYTQGNAMFPVHPFIEANSTLLFPDVDEFLNYFVKYVNVFTGINPMYQGSLYHEKDF